MSNTITVTLTANEPIISAVDDIDWISLKYSTNRSRIRTTYIGQDVSYRYYAGRAYPIAETAGQINRTFSFDAAFKDKVDAAKFEGLRGRNVVYKDADGRIARGVLIEMTKQSERYYDSYQCSIRQVDDAEAVEYE